MLGYKPIKYNLNCELNILETDDLNNIFKWRLNAKLDGDMNIDIFKKFMEPYFVIYKNYSVDRNKIIVNKNREIIKCWN